MHGSVVLEVGFLSQNNVYVYIENTLTGLEAKHAEIRLCVAYALRHAGLAKPEILVSIGESLEVYDHFSGNVRIFTNDLLDAFEIDLVPQPTENVKRKFRYRIDISGENITTKMTTSGFGILGRGLDYYSPISIHTVIVHMLNERSDDIKYCKLLCESMTLLSPAMKARIKPNVLDEKQVSFECSNNSYPIF